MKFDNKSFARIKAVGFTLWFFSFFIAQETWKQIWVWFLSMFK